MELLAVHVTGAAVNLMLVVVYRPESQTVTSVFFDDFADLVERMAVHAAPIVIIGDINLHLDDQFASSMIRGRFKYVHRAHVRPSPRPLSLTSTAAPPKAETLTAMRIESI